MDDVSLAVLVRHHEFGFRFHKKFKIFVRLSKHFDKGGGAKGLCMRIDLSPDTFVPRAKHDVVDEPLTWWTDEKLTECLDDLILTHASNRLEPHTIYVDGKGTLLLLDTIEGVHA